MKNRKMPGSTNKSKKVRGYSESARRKRGDLDGTLLDIVRMFERTYGPPTGRKRL